MIHLPVPVERLEQLKSAEPAVYLHLEELFKEGKYSNMDLEHIRRLMNLGYAQLQAACSWFEYDLMLAPHKVAELESVINQRDQIPTAERPVASINTLSDRLISFRKEIEQKENLVESSRKDGAFWSIVPLLAFFDLSAEERADKSCYPLLPYFMQEAYTEMLLAKQQKSG